MSEIPSVVVIIPTFNEHLFIKKCLSSVYNQTFFQYIKRILVIDGGSTDGTITIINEEAIKMPKVHLFNNPKKIQSAAFNMGVDFSEEDVIVRLDAHAFYDSKYIELCVYRLISNKTYGNVGGRWIILPYNNSYMAGIIAKINTIKFAMGGADYRSGMIAKEVETVPFGAFPRSVVNEVGVMNESLCRGEDNEYNQRIIGAGYKIFFDPNIFCKYYSRPSFISFIRQMFNNGVSIGVLMRQNFKAISIRHHIPFLFVLFLVFFSFLSFFSKFFLIVLGIVVTLYAVLDFTVSLLSCIKNKLHYFPIIFIMIFLIHITYGIGTIYGLLMGKY